MVSRGDDRILYDDSVDEIRVQSRGPISAALAVLALVAGMIYVSWTAPSSGGSKDSLAQETSKPIAAPRSGFDASSDEIKACDGTAQTRPDFSIVVPGASSNGQQVVDGPQVVARVVQFVVIDSNDESRNGPEVQVESLCTLP